MSTKLYFKVQDLAPLIAHAQNAKTHRATFAQAYGPDLEPIKNPEVQPALHWVKDEGIYLVPNGQLPEGNTFSSTGLVLYADGFNPNFDTNVWDRSREAVGGDDFVEAIALSELDEVLKGRNEGYFFITVYPSYFAIGWQKSR